MSDPARRRNIAESLARAAQALAVAEAALAIGGTADPGMIFDAEDAREQIAEVREFGARAAAILRAEQLLEP